jgi:hypothetical protein
LLVAVFAALTLAPPAGAALPPIKHVFIVVLENKNYDDTFGKDSKAPYLAQTLVGRGQLLPEYYGIGHFSLTNYVALVSGQAPNPHTQSDCQVFTEFVPGTIGADGQATGAGCVYPAAVKTVADQLTAKGLTWGGYMEDMAATPTEEQTCRHPALGQRDNTQSAREDDQYAARHNPFVYFHSIIDSPDCQNRVVDLSRLPTTLDGDDVPNYVFITPDLCSDGHDEPCIDGRPGGLESINTFLQEWIPKIEASRAYADGGLIIVTFDESESGSASCCIDDAPNTPNAGGLTPGAGGGKVGAVLLSPYITGGTVNDKPYNHYSLLRSVEDLFGLEPLGYAGRSTGFGADVFNGPTCFDHPLPRKRNGGLPRGTLLSSVIRAGRKLTITLAHSAKIAIRAQLPKNRTRTLRRSAKACGKVSVTLPRGTRAVTVVARVGKRSERRKVAAP